MPVDHSRLIRTVAHDRHLQTASAFVVRIIMFLAEKPDNRRGF